MFALFLFLCRKWGWCDMLILWSLSMLDSALMPRPPCCRLRFVLMMFLLSLATAEFYSDYSAHSSFQKRKCDPLFELAEWLKNKIWKVKSNSKEKKYFKNSNYDRRWKTHSPILDPPPLVNPKFRTELTILARGTVEVCYARFWVAAFQSNTGEVKITVTKLSPKNPKMAY